MHIKPHPEGGVVPVVLYSNVHILHSVAPENHFVCSFDQSSDIMPFQYQFVSVSNVAERLFSRMHAACATGGVRVLAYIVVKRDFEM